VGDGSLPLVTAVLLLIYNNMNNIKNTCTLLTLPGKQEKSSRSLKRYV